MRAIHDTEFPNSVDATQKLVDEQGAEYDRLKVSSNDYYAVSLDSDEPNSNLELDK